MRFPVQVNPSYDSAVKARAKSKNLSLSKYGASAIESDLRSAGLIGEETEGTDEEILAYLREIPRSRIRAALRREHRKFTQESRKSRKAKGTK